MCSVRSFLEGLDGNEGALIATVGIESLLPGADLVGVFSPVVSSNSVLVSPALFCGVPFSVTASSASSAISSSLFRRKELDDEVNEPDVWSMHADDKAVSVMSVGAAIENVVSYGENLSRTA